MTELQNDRQDKNNRPPDLRSRGHKNIPFKVSCNQTCIPNNTFSVTRTYIFDNAALLRSPMEIQRLFFHFKTSYIYNKTDDSYFLLPISNERYRSNNNKLQSIHFI